MIRHGLFAILVSALGSSAAFAQGAPSDPITLGDESDGAITVGGAAAIVNDEVISIADVTQRARFILIGRQLPMTTETLQQAIPVALDQLIDERLQLQKAAEYELEVEAEAIEREVSGMAQNAGLTVPEFYDALQASGINPNVIEEQMRAEIAWRRIMSGLYGQRIRISQVQIDDMLDRMKAQASEPRYQLSEIFLFAPTPEDRSAVLPNAQQLRLQLDEGVAPFPLAAQRFSQSPTAASGGDMGWVSPNELDVAVQNALATTTPPALVGPLEAEDGIYIVAFRGRQDPVGTGEVEVELKQLVTLSENQSDLEAAIELATDCDSVADAANSSDNVILADLGRIPVSSLTPTVRDVVDATPVGTVSDLFDTRTGKAAVFVCERFGVRARLARPGSDRRSALQSTNHPAQ